MMAGNRAVSRAIATQSSPSAASTDEQDAFRSATADALLVAVAKGDSGQCRDILRASARHRAQLTAEYRRVAGTDLHDDLDEAGGEGSQPLLLAP